MGGRRDIGERAHGRRHDLPRRAIVEVENQDSLLGLRARQRLDGHLGHGGERAPGAGEELAQVIAGDVLDHASAGFERLAAPGNGGHAEEMVARGAGFDAPRARQIGRDRAADGAGAGAGRRAEDDAVIHGLEGEFLLARRQQRFDLDKRRCGPRREHQLLGLVKRDAGEPRKIERCVPLRRPADRALAAAADDFERLARRQRPLDRLFDVRGIARFEIFSVHLEA